LTIEQIKTEIDQIERTLFFHSLYRIGIEELEVMQERLKEIKEAFLQIPFTVYKVSEQEEIRFALAEVTISIDIDIKELLHLDVTVEISKLEKFNRTA